MFACSAKSWRNVAGRAERMWNGTEWNGSGAAERGCGMMFLRTCFVCVRRRV